LLPEIAENGIFYETKPIKLIDRFADMGRTAVLSLSIEVYRSKVGDIVATEALGFHVMSARFALNYNFVKYISSCALAIEACVADRIWDVVDTVKLVEEAEPKPG
jgi:hypothetical protein